MLFHRLSNFQREGVTEKWLIWFPGLFVSISLINDLRRTDGRTQSHSIDPLRGLKATYVGQKCYISLNLFHPFSHANPHSITTVHGYIFNLWKWKHNHISFRVPLLEDLVALKRTGVFELSVYCAYFLSLSCFPFLCSSSASCFI